MNWREVSFSSKIKTTRRKDVAKLGRVAISQCVQRIGAQTCGSRGLQQQPASHSWSLPVSKLGTSEQARVVNFLLAQHLLTRSGTMVECDLRPSRVQPSLLASTPIKSSRMSTDHLSITLTYQVDGVISRGLRFGRVQREKRQLYGKSSSYPVP